MSFQHQLRLPDTKEYRRLIKNFKTLAFVENVPLWQLTAMAMEEYIDRHAPGNPQLTLDIRGFGGSIPDPKTIREKKEEEPRDLDPQVCSDCNTCDETVVGFLCPKCRRKRAFERGRL